jgi:hypothetical protein
MSDSCLMAILIGCTAIGPVQSLSTGRPFDLGQFAHPQCQGLVRPEIQEGVRVLNNDNES